jgi:eukaryotic-like serine/threonine-protein kinase
LPTEPPDPEAPRVRRFAGYDLVARVSVHRGVSTFRAVQVTLGRHVLVSVLPPDAAKLYVNREHFHRRQEVASRLRHENVISTIDAGTFKGCRYFVTEDVGDRTLADELAKHKRLDVARAVEIARDVAGALAYLDAAGVVHRNVAPKSIHLTDTDVVKLAGFDLAKDRRPGGHETWIDHDGETAYYLAPEFLGGERGIDVRADVYSLGCVLYHMLTGHAPFAAKSAAVVLESHATKVPTDPRELREGLSPALVGVLDRCLRKRKEHRYAKADDLAKDLDAVRLGRAPGKVPSEGALWPAAGPKILPRLRRE